MKPIRKLLIANRGEIACRIMRTARARGIKTVAVYSHADESAMHVRLADEAFCIGAAAPSESYLKIDAVLEAARAAGADAIHPGYGFLSERAAFAEACERAGIVFVGPPASAIAAMGDKAESKRRMIAAGVPCIPGYQDEDQSDERLAKEAVRIGFPVMLKASAGGGGRGQRIVQRAEELAEAIASARRESESAFGDGRLIVEKAVAGARHVEIQVIADAHGSTLYLGERDCSLQRRRQKVIEEAPSPVMSPALRRAMGEAACEAARAVGYRNAGTVEFLFDPQTNAFYFLEMNTRLQVEHPVTECVTGLDIVSLMLDVAEGKPLPLKQDDVRCDGWAMEARLYAEDPAKGFLPQTGRILALDFAVGEGVRVDAGVEAGDNVSSHYDPMIAKIIAHAPTRGEAAARLAAALEETTLLGLATNAPFLVALLRDEAFLSGAADTGYIERRLGDINARAHAPVTVVDVALLAAAFSDAEAGALLTGWNSRGAAPFPMKLQCGDATILARATLGRTWALAEIGAETARIEILHKDARRIRYRHGGRVAEARYARHGDAVDLQHGAGARRYADITFAPAGEGGAAADVVKAPMAGVVTTVGVNPGGRVAKGETLVTIEAMKMEHKLTAPRDGVVAEVAATVGAQVAIRTVLVRLERE